jgi:2-hydroxy-6-oxo-6-(2'-carboxyphenyl)-hexa-2,4-dienoate hydrolase
MDQVPSDFRKLKQPLSCDANSIAALVTVHGQQRDPAKVVVSNVIDNQGQISEGVTFVSLPEPAWASSMADDDAKFVDVDGIRTRYFEKGNGDALLLLHGGQPTGRAGGALAWTRNFDGLSERFRVFALDRLGQGQTGNPKTQSDYENYYQGVIDHAYGFIEAMGLEKVHLVGHSQGGWPVTRLALDHPDLVSCVVNVDSVMAAGETNLHTARYYLHITTGVHPESGETAHSIRRTRELQSHTLNNITLAGASRGLTLAQQPKILEADKELQKLQMSPRHPAFQSLRDQARQEIKYGKLTVPSLIIWGYNDPSSPFEGGLELFEFINAAATHESRMYVFNNAGHSSYVEYPEEFNSVVTNFCSRY